MADDNNNPKTADNPLDEIDWSKIKLERGKTPDGVKQKCFKLCQDYLAQVWLTLTIDEIEFKRLSGGLTNQLYYCAVPEDKQTADCDVAQEVAIRLYSPKHFNNYEKTGNERLSDTIIALLVSENGIGPKIHGIFEDGQMQQFYKHRQFRVAEQQNAKLIDQLARKLARVHAMEVPVKKSGNWLFDTFDNFYAEADKLFDLPKLYEEAKCPTLAEHDLKKELDWFKQAVLRVDSPVTFTHIDFRGSNIMVTEPNDEIVLCDLEYSCYGFRGFDFGSFFFEWGKELFQWFQEVKYPEYEQVRPFIDTYIEESTKLSGNEFSADPRNTSQHIYNESKVFALASLMFFVVMSLKANESILEDIPFEKIKQMAFTEMSYKQYHGLKNKFIEDNVLK